MTTTYNDDTTLLKNSERKYAKADKALAEYYARKVSNLLPR